jgi:hypothetical protein
MIRIFRMIGVETGSLAEMAVGTNTAAVRDAADTAAGMADTAVRTIPEPRRSAGDAHWRF